MFVVDTSVLIYAADQDALAHRQCRGLVDRWRRQSSEWYLTWPIVARNLMHDAHTAVLMREHGIRQVYTRDTDFYRFPFLDTIDPLAAT